MDGISLSWRLLSQKLIDQHALSQRVVQRCEQAEPEYHFLGRDNCPLLPAWVGNELRVVPWGCPGSRSRLPKAKSIEQESVLSGRWQAWEPEPVILPANFVWDRGVWYRVREGVAGVLVKNEAGVLIAYPLTEPASHYYQVMTRNSRMPVLCGERI